MTERDILDLNLFTGSDQKETEDVRDLLNRWGLQAEEFNESDSGTPLLITPVGTYEGYEKIEGFCRISRAIKADLLKK